MFEVGFSEMVVIFALALVVLGPEKLPKLVAQIGRWAGRARAMARQFRDQLENEAEVLSATEAKLRSTDLLQPEKPPEPVVTESKQTNSTESNESSPQRGA